MFKQKSQIINALRHLLPPDAVIDVGIGTGNGEMHQWRDWEVPLALLIDAEPERVEWLHDWIEQRKGWQLATVLLTDDTIEQDFFIASNKAESGVIAIEQLQQIWPNMQLKEQQVLQTQRLHSLLLSPSSQALREASCIWGIVDCLPALPVLKGAGDALKQWSVLWVRVVLDDVFSDSEQQSHSSLVVVTDFLSPLGYRCVEVVEENHPALGYALFIQDWHKHYEVSLLENTQIKQVSDSQTKQLEVYKAQLEKLEQQCEQQEAQTNQLEAYKVQVVKLEQQCKQQEAQTKQLEDYKKQITELQQQLQERDYRQKLLDEEFIKAEVQIELIKDIFLKDNTN